MDFNEVIITVIRYVMYLAPLGIFALIASTISHLGLQIIFTVSEVSIGLWIRHYFIFGHLDFGYHIVL